jgi:hypothetical protein
MPQIQELEATPPINTPPPAQQAQNGANFQSLWDESKYSSATSCHIMTLMPFLL